MEGLHSNACPVIVSFLSRITSERDWVYIKGDGCRYPSREAPDDIINVPEVASEPETVVQVVYLHKGGTRLSSKLVTFAVGEFVDEETSE